MFLGCLFAREHERSSENFQRVYRTRPLAAAFAEGGEFIDTVAISESDRRKIAYGNAKVLYKL